MIKIFRNIRKQSLEKGSLQKYILYAIGEIILVVVGILIALSINNWNNNKFLKQTELKIYKNLKNQITKDRDLLIGIIEFNQTYYDQFKFATQLIEKNDRAKIDTLVQIVPNIYRYSDVNIGSNIYQNLVNSGDIKLLKNSAIIERVQGLEELYIYINRTEENHFMMILQFGGTLLFDNINFSTNEIQSPDEIYSFKFQNRLLAFMVISEEKDEIYHRALNEIDAISELIENELNE